ncbi:hypothetical protein Angca_004105, partial [Angiostrongylus cantonensis]
IAEENQHPLTVIRKKQVIVLTDYIPLNVTDAMNAIRNVRGTRFQANEQKFGLLHQLDTTEFELAADFPVYSVADDMNITRIRADFQKPVNFEVPSSVYQAKPLARSELFMTEFDSGTLLRLLENAVSGDMCHVPSNKMYNDFLAIRFAHNGSIHSLDFQNYVHFIFSQELSEVYDTITLPLLQRGFLNTSVDWQVIQDNSFYLNKFSTSCKSAIPFVPLVAARPYHKPKELYIAMDDMLWITLCAAISVGVFGILIYQHVKRQQRKRMEILTEMMLQPKLYKTARECPKVARLPWEIKSDHVHIDMEFLLGEGTISNVYLGKLKGKSPILQWIARVEMKQYQDCPVAVRVPRHFDEPEEDQLLREISSMRRLRHHDHIALFLGWTNKNDLVCSLLELTHMNLLKYLGQISETVSSGEAKSTAYIPYQMLYKIIYEICDGMSYIHSRNLIHRDLAARNVLLTTGLRAKISGFGFCSDADDPKFSGTSLAVRYLPVRWLAPESFHGKFSRSSDTLVF